MQMPKELWWEKYRRRRSTRLTLELVLRKSISDTAREYLDHCDIAGVQKIRSREKNFVERLVHIILFMSMFSILCYVLHWTKAQTLKSPLVVTMESSTYPISSIDFPAIALCNINRISLKAMLQYAKELHDNHTTYGKNKQHRSFEYAVNYTWEHGKLIDFLFTEDTKVSFHSEEMHDTTEENTNIVKMMKRLAPKCEEMLLRCIWDGKLVECKSVFKVRRTVRGHCCAFNYILDYELAGRPSRTIEESKRQVISGFLHGLHVVMDPMIEDYAYPINIAEGFEIFLFDPTNFADTSTGRVIHRVIGPNEATSLELQSVKQLATPEVRFYPQSTRKCLFHDESQENFGSMYSLSTCLVNCRIKTVKSLCKCTPYFLPTKSEVPVCTLERLRCLNKYKEKLLYLYPLEAEQWEGLEMEIEDSLYCPECLPDCEFTQHFSRAFKMPITLSTSTLKSYGHKEHLLPYLVGLNLTDKCILSVFQSSGDGTLNRLDVISYWFEILSNVGGFASLLLGLSIISAVETCYYLFIYFPYILYKNYKKYY